MSCRGGSCQFPCPIGSVTCEATCCGRHEHCINGTCQCVQLRGECDTDNNLCCQDEPTYCYPNGVVSTVGERCCRPVGGTCDPTHDQDAAMTGGKGDCCSNFYYFNGTYFFGNCGRDGVCGGPGAICSDGDDCVSGQCVGHCDNISPVQRCTQQAECGNGACIERTCR